MNSIILPGITRPLIGFHLDCTEQFMLPVLDRPVVTHLIELLARHDLRDILLGVPQTASKVKSLLGNGSEWGVRIRYAQVEDGGNVGLLFRQMRPHLDDSFTCMFSNTVTDVDISRLIAAHRSTAAMMTLAVCFPGAETGRICPYQSMPFRVSIAAAVIEPGVLRFLYNSESAVSLATAATVLTARHQLVNVCLFDAMQIDIVSADSLRKAGELMQGGQFAGTAECAGDNAKRIFK